MTLLSSGCTGSISINYGLYVYIVRPGERTYDDVTNITIRRGDMGFGFRVVGGNEEGTQVRATDDDDDGIGVSVL